MTCDMRKQPDNNCKGPRGRYRDPARGSERAVAGVGLPFMTRRAKVVFGSEQVFRIGYQASDFHH
ncbi:hypothetical protein BQ8794_10138 [Mesorhizobium prunaredense]|uniref:Uncharacterized protein n=1 Tax=Mesorhizobium prunaredense TaxID=1631249 RepID=A0A1R3UYR6_9HYPH|nr:hypothetical protein BQ8794_10138 [Mesorhizobium prunaredense]